MILTTPTCGCSRLTTSSSDVRITACVDRDDDDDDDDDENTKPSPEMTTMGFGLDLARTDAVGAVRA
jgi:hypothetical protein